MSDQVGLSATAAEVSRFNDWFDRKCVERGIEPSLAADLKLCVNEVLANLISHGFKNTRKPWMAIRVRLEPGRASATISDNGTFFDLRKWEVPKDRNLWTAEPGGFGVGLVKERASEIHYARICGVNRLRIVCTDPRP